MFLTQNKIILADKMSDYVIIVAGGSGTRMQSQEPKQFLPLAGKAILHHTIEAFHKYDPTFKYIVALPKEYIEYWKSHSALKKVPGEQILVEGGAERFYTVKNALEHVKGPGIVLIHDGVRPLVSKQTIKNCIEKAKVFGNAVPVIPIVDSVRHVHDNGSHPVNRHHLRIVQTPQCFDIGLLKKAYDSEFLSSFTDDASVIEHFGAKIHLVDGNQENIKITTPYDMQLAEFLLAK